jgi:hypothetical protein
MAVRLPLQPGRLSVRRGCPGETAAWITVEMERGETLRLDLP